MITQFKLYENLADPKVNDYVICCESDPLGRYPMLDKFLRSSIGVIVTIGNSTDDYPYTVHYENIPECIEQYFSKTIPRQSITSNTRNFNVKEILSISENRNDLEKILTQQRFDL